MAMKSHYGGALRDSWFIEGSYFYWMIDCGRREYNQCVENALTYLPTEVLEKHKESLVFISTSNACRVAPAYRNREIILLADGIFPKLGAVEDEADMRYFIFAVLHEIAHAIRNHKSGKFDSISEDEEAAQEQEADEIALEWFNLHVDERGNPYLPRLTPEEIEIARTRDRERIEQFVARE